MMMTEHDKLIARRLNEEMGLTEEAKPQPKMCSHPKACHFHTEQGTYCCSCGNPVQETKTIN